MVSKNISVLSECLVLVVPITVMLLLTNKEVTDTP